MNNMFESTPVGAFFAVYADLSGGKMFISMGAGHYEEPWTGEAYPDKETMMDAGYFWFFDLNEDDAFMNQGLDILEQREAREAYESGMAEMERKNG